jgi:hypothetical protein
MYRLSPSHALVAAKKNGPNREVFAVLFESASSQASAKAASAGEIT